MNLDGLTPRQHEIALLAARGLTYAQIGERVGLTTRYSKRVLLTIYRLTGVRNREELALFLGLGSDPTHRVPGSRWAELTRREREVLKLLAAGYSASLIAAGLKIGESTVRMHLSNICARLGLSRSSQLERLCVRWQREGILRIRPEGISDREHEVLQAVADGLSNKEIARRLVISRQTVKNHISSLNAKLGALDRTQLAMMAARRGWVNLRHNESDKEATEATLREMAKYRW